VSGVAHVIDGDTIVVEGIHVRLMGVDAEELSEPNGPEAKRYMQFLVNVDEITCTLTGERSYERYIGSCFNRGADLAAGMVANGKALDCARYSHGKYRQFEPKDVRLRLIQKNYCH
jgi:endonuclease YncB( thermonuclease family)